VESDAVGDVALCPSVMINFYTACTRTYHLLPDNKLVVTLLPEYYIQCPGSWVRVLLRIVLQQPEEPSHGRCANDSKI
jgi:hypothetical protein